MLDQVVTNQIQKTAEKVLQPGMNDVPLAYLMGLDIPESIKHFFDQEVETWLTEEDERVSMSERFDYERPEVRMLIDQIFDMLKQGVAFDQPTFHRILERAIKLEMNYLLKPHQTLTQFIFKDSPKVTTIEVHNTLRYFFRLSYYKDALTDYFNQKYMQEVTETQFKELIDQIDKKAYDADPVDFTLKTVMALMGFVREGMGDEEINALPVDILTKALEDRKFDEYVRHLEKAESQGLTELTLEEMEALFKTGQTPADIKESAATEAIEEEETTAVDVSSIEEEKPVVEVSDIDVSAVPEPEVVVEEEEEDEDDYEDEEEEEVAVAEKPVAGTAGEQLADFVAGQISKGEPLEDLNKLMLKKEYKRFLKKLFKKDEKGFKEFIDELNDYTSWKDASVAIEDEFYQRQVNPYSKEAIAFSDICYKRFFPKDHIKALGD